MHKTIGELVDELSITNIKMSRWNHEKLDLYNKPALTQAEKDYIIELDKKIMATNEKRVALKNALNEIFGQTVEMRTYEISGNSKV